jgi:hypothetical protein
MFFPTDVAQTSYGLFPAIFVVYFIYEAYMFSKLAIVILLLFFSFSIADNLVIIDYFSSVSLLVFICRIHTVSHVQC